MSDLASGIVLVLFGAAAIAWSRRLPGTLAVLRERAAERGDVLRAGTFERWGPRALAAAGAVLVVLGVVSLVEAAT